MSTWLTATIEAAAAIPAMAYCTSLPESILRTAWNAAYAASIDSVQLQMLKIWMYQALRFFSHSGMCWIRPMNATSSGGSSIAAGIRNTIVVWYDWLRGVRTTKSCATAAIKPRMTKVVQPGVCGLRRERSGTTAKAVASATTTKYAAAFVASFGAPSPAEASTSWRIGLGTALKLPSPPLASG